MLTPASDQSWNLYMAAHLLNRVGFGGTPDEIKALCKLGRHEAIEQLLTPPAAPATPPVIQARTDFATVRMELAGLDDAAKKEKLMEIRRQAVMDMRDLRVWWVDRMAQSDSASVEKATLFWHGHFATSIQKVKDPDMMARQNQTFRAEAFGNFGTLVKAMSRDPAMIVWLDLERSERDNPNENFAREVMELFTLGIGNYTENDIKQAALAFTGYRINRQDDTFRFAGPQHNETAKTFLGETGNFSGDDIINLILKQPACAKFICKKLWTFYAYEDPEPEIVNGLAQVLRNHDYELRPVFREMFASRAFNSEKAVRTQIKSPVQLIVQTARSLQCEPPGGFVLQQLLNTLGQILFAPPNVKGWDGNRSWINTSTLTARNDFTAALLANRHPKRPLMIATANPTNPSNPSNPSNPASPAPMPPPQPRVDLDQIIPAGLDQKPEQLVDYLVFRLFQTPLTNAEKQRFTDYLTQPGTNGKPHSTRELLVEMMKNVQFQLV